jgi:DNA-directed RNA polymerase subunit L
MNLLEPKLDNFETNNDVLTFTIKNINVSIVNAIRRTILSEIPCVVFRTMPYEKSLVNITKNTTRLNNEIIKQRLSCIPIHITDLSIPLDKYVVELDMENNTNEVMYITTEHFKIKDSESDRYLIEREVKRIFPPNELTKEHILLTRLRPRLSDDIPGESLSFNAKMVVSNAKEDSGFNVVSTCSYEFSKDMTRIQSEWSKKEKELKQDGMSESDILFEKENWMLHDAKRIFKENEFNFIIETIGVFDNKTILSKSCDIMNGKLQKVIDDCDSQTLEIKQSTNLMKSFDVILHKEDYSLGKSIEYALNDLFYMKNDILAFVGFRKDHPHDDYSIIRIGFKDDATTKEPIYTIMKQACMEVQKVFENIKSQL